MQGLYICTSMYLSKRHQRCNNYAVNVDHILYSKNVFIYYRDITVKGNSFVFSIILQMNFIWVLNIKERMSTGFLSKEIFSLSIQKLNLMGKLFKWGE